MVDENVYCRAKGECSRRQRHLGESRVDIPLSHVRRGDQVQEPRGQRYKEGQIDPGLEMEGCGREPVGQVYFDVLNRHLSYVFQGLRLNSKTVSDCLIDSLHVSRNL